MEHFSCVERCTGNGTGTDFLRISLTANDKRTKDITGHHLRISLKMTWNCSRNYHLAERNRVLRIQIVSS